DSRVSYPSLWRLYAMSIDGETVRMTGVRTRSAQNLHPNQVHSLDLYVYHVNYDGTSYVPVRRCFSIYYYPGEKDIMSLIIYPLRFAKNPETIKESLRQQGLRFVRAIEKKHLVYNGWTVAFSPTKAE